MTGTVTQVHDMVLADGSRWRVSWAGATDIGHRRGTNQDAFFAEFPLFVVADGMGGHAGGEIASRSTVDRMRAAVETGVISPDSIQSAIALAVGDIADHSESTDEGTGTTLTGVYVDQSQDPARWVSLNIGDSRVYLSRDAQLTQITTDHSVVQEMISSGRLSQEEAEGHPYSNVITRAVGASETTQPDYVAVDLLDGDRFVICSDGLTKELTDYGIQHFLDLNPDPGTATDAMLSAALDNGGRDNVTLVVVQLARVDDESSTETPNAA